MILECQISGGNYFMFLFIKRKEKYIEGIIDVQYLFYLFNNRELLIEYKVWFCLLLFLKYQYFYDVE